MGNSSQYPERGKEPGTVEESRLGKRLELWPWAKTFRLCAAETSVISLPRFPLIWSKWLDAWWKHRVLSALLSKSLTATLRDKSEPKHHGRRELQREHWIPPWYVCGSEWVCASVRVGAHTRAHMQKSEEGGRRCQVPSPGTSFSILGFWHEVPHWT